MQSYVYDNNGNVVTTSDNAKTQSAFEYSNNNLTKMVTPDGSNYEYQYDSKKNVISASSSEGLKYNLEYDQYGNPINTQIMSNNSNSLQSEKTYFIRNKQSGKYLSANDTDINLKNRSEYSQKELCWKVEKNDDGTYRIKSSSGTGFCLDVEGAVTTNGAKIINYACHDGDSQRFKITPQDDFTFEIASKITNFNSCIAPEDSYSEVAKIVQSEFDKNNDSHKWYFEELNSPVLPESNGIYYLRSAKSGQYLEVQNVNTETSACLIQNYFNGRDNQRFKLYGCSDGCFSIVPIQATNRAVQISSSFSPYCGYNTANINYNTGTYNTHMKFKWQVYGFAILAKVDESFCLDFQHLPYTYCNSICFSKYTSSNSNQQWILERVPDSINSSATYQNNGNYLQSITDSRGYKTTYDYNIKNGTLNSITDAKNNTTSYAYDKMGVMTSVTKAGISNSYSYAQDKLNSITHNGFNYNFDYDQFGNSKKVSVGNQALIENQYEPNNGNLLKSIYGNGNSVGYTYDSNDQTIEKKYNDSVMFKYKYDKLGNLAQSQDLVNNTTFSYQYDLSKRLMGISGSNNQKTNYSFDEKNRLSNITSSIKDVKTTTAYNYNNNNLIDKVSTVQGSNTLNQKNTFDELCRLEQKTFQFNTSKPDTTWYTYLSNQKATTTLIKSIKNGNNYKLSYDYDELGNIIKIYENDKLKSSFSYDELNQLKSEIVNGVTTTYTYDKGGNITSRTAGDKTTTWEYGNSNWKDLLTSFNGQEITYDEIGNPLSYRDGISFTWQNGRQLAGLEKQGLTTSYKYNDSGIRTQKTVNGVTTNYYLNGNSIVTQISGSDRLDFAYDENGDLYGFYYNGEPYFYFRNAQNDIACILDRNTQEVVRYEYDSWGKLESVTGKLASTVGEINPFHYRGYYYDTETGLYYLNSRYYDPVTCRFLNADDILGANQDVLSYNLFAYCSNNPINYIDPNGNMLMPIIGPLAGPTVSMIGSVIKKIGSVIGSIISSIPSSSILGYSTTIMAPIVLMSKKYTNRPDSGLIGVPDNEISEKARDESLAGSERNRYKQEEKVRGLRNKQKRLNKIAVPDFPDLDYDFDNFDFDLFTDRSADLPGLPDDFRNSKNIFDFNFGFGVFPALPALPVF